MRILTDLKAALDGNVQSFDDVLDHDTVAALVAVAEAAAASGCYTCVGLVDSQSAGWPCNAPAARLAAALAPLLVEDAMRPDAS